MYLRFSVIKVLLFFTAIAYAQPQENIKGNAAFLFAYYPKEGQQSNFENGYKQHLKWHEEKNDPLPWYGWNVISGDRPGLFIDGTFGISYEALDNRVDPLNDRKDFAQTVAPYADPVFREAYELIERFSTVQSLEKWQPTTMIDVHRVTTKPGANEVFERLFDP